jgi:hypothetical protein
MGVYVDYSLRLIHAVSIVDAGFGGSAGVGVAFNDPTARLGLGLGLGLSISLDVLLLPGYLSHGKTLCF